MTRSSSRLPADRTLAKDSVEVNQTFGSFDAKRRSPRARASEALMPHCSQALSAGTGGVETGVRNGAKLIALMQSEPSRGNRSPLRASAAVVCAALVVFGVFELHVDAD